MQHGHHCCRSPSCGARKTSHNLAHLTRCVFVILLAWRITVALTRVDLTTRLDLRSSWSWLVVSCFIDVRICRVPSLHIILSWLRRVLVFTSWNFVSPEVLLLADECPRIFCSGERRLFLSLRRRNHLVSDVDRRETGLFPRKIKTSLPGSFFCKKCELFQLGEAALGAVACLSKHRRQHGWTCPRLHGGDDQRLGVRMARPTACA